MNALLKALQRRKRLQINLVKASVAVGMNMANLRARVDYYINTLLNNEYTVATPGDLNVAVAVDSDGNPLADVNLSLKRHETFTGPTRTLKGYFVGWADSVTTSTITGSRYSVTNKQYDSATNVTTFDVLVSAGIYGQFSDNPRLQLTGTRRTGGSTGSTNTGVVDLAVCALGYTPADLIAGKIWTDEGIAFAARHASLRFMDAHPVKDQAWDSSVNQDGKTEWAGPSRKSYQGNSFDELIDLANKSGTPPWFNIGLLWDDQSIRDLVLRVDAQLSLPMYARFEYSNENWNSGFAAFHRTLEFTCIEAKGFVGENNGYTRVITYGRSNGVLTLQMGADHGWTVGQPVYMNYVGDGNTALYGAQTIQSLPTARSATFNSPGPDVAAGTQLYSGTWVVYDKSTLGQDGTDNIYYMRLRWVDRRLMQVSEIIRSAIGDAKMNTRIRMVYADQMGNDPGQLTMGLDWLAQHFPQRAIGQKLAGSNGAYFYSWAGAPYFQGPNDTLTAINVPGKTAEEVGAELLDGARVAKHQYKYNFDRRIAEAAARGLEPEWYEGGADTYAAWFMSDADRQIRAAAQFLPIAGVAVTAILTDWFSAGGGLATWYHNGTADPVEDGGLGQYAWGFHSRSLTDIVSPKPAAIAALQASGVAVTRNVLPANVGDSVTLRVGSSDGWYDDGTTVDFGAHGYQDLRFLLNSAVDGTYSVSFEYSCTITFNYPSVQLYSGLAPMGDPFYFAISPDHSITHVSPEFSLGVIKKGPWMMRLRNREFTGNWDNPNINYRGFRITRTA